MIVVDRAIRARLETGPPVRVGLYGMGAMARGMLLQVERHMKVLRVDAVCNRSVDRAIDAFLAAGVERSAIEEVSNLGELQAALEAGKRAVTDDPRLIAESPSIDIVVEATGHVEYGAGVTTACIEQGKDIVSLNVELDATIGPLLRKRAAEAGVLFSGADGDQPGVTMNLVRYVEAMGLRPLVCGNIKGLQDRYRNPTTQEGFAKRWRQKPAMVASFADGTKMSAEQAVVANETGMKVSQRGMIGRHHDGHVDELVDLYDVEELRALGGIVDYVVGAKPSPGIYVLAEARDDNQAFFLELGKLGTGPLYSFYTPWHLTILEFGISIARVALCRDVVIGAPRPPSVDVCAAAKVPLRPGETLDGLGGYKTYGVAENYETSAREGLLPVGLAEGCRVKRALDRDEVLRYEDIDPPVGSLVHKLRQEQESVFSPDAIRPVS